MKKIGQGYFYDVYDLGNGRVLKKSRSFLDIAKSTKAESWKARIDAWMKARRFIKECVKTTEEMKEKISGLPQDLIGNPTFVTSVDYEQDKVLLLMDYFESHSLEENKRIVDSYIELVKTLLKYGVHDYVYKFKNSYGVNQNGEVVFVDFNEVTFSKEKVLELVAEKRWQTEAQYRKFPEGDLKDYLGMRFSEALTPSVINSLWRLNMKD